MQKTPRHQIMWALTGRGNPKESGVDWGAFSLLELLVVVAVISILAALLLPTLSKSKQKAHAIKCVNNMRQINLACSIYSEENQDIIVPMARKVESDRAELLVPYGSYVWWSDTLRPYLKGDPKVYTCPAVPIVQAGVTMSNAFGIAMNFNELGVFPDNPDPKTGRFVKYSMVQNPSDTVFFGDAAYVKNPGEQNADKWEADLQRRYSWSGFGVWLFVTPPARNDQWNQNCTRIINRHLGVANCSFVDGHVKAIKTSKIGWQYPRGNPNAMWDR